MVQMDHVITKYHRRDNLLPTSISCMLKYILRKYLLRLDKPIYFGYCCVVSALVASVVADVVLVADVVPAAVPLVSIPSIVAHAAPVVPATVAAAVALVPGVLLMPKILLLLFLLLPKLLFLLVFML